MVALQKPIVGSEVPRPCAPGRHEKAQSSRVAFLFIFTTKNLTDKLYFWNEKQSVVNAITLHKFLFNVVILFILVPLLLLLGFFFVHDITHNLILP